MCLDWAKQYDGDCSAKKYFCKRIRDLHQTYFWAHLCVSETILSPLMLPWAPCIRSEKFSSKRFVLLSPITDWHVSLGAQSFIPVDLIFHTCNVIAHAKQPAWKSEQSNQKGGPGIFFQIGSDGFLVKKRVCLSLALSDSYEFSNGNLASCVLTEIAPPAHLGSEEKKKKGWFGACRVRHARCTRTSSLPVNNIFLRFVSRSVKANSAPNAKETFPKCQIKQLQLTYSATCDWQPSRVSVANKRTEMQW